MPHQQFDANRPRNLSVNKHNDSLRHLYDRCNNKIEKCFYKEKGFYIYKTNGLVTYEITDQPVEKDLDEDIYFRNNLIIIQPLIAEIHYLQNFYPYERASTLRGRLLGLVLGQRTKKLDKMIAYGLFVALKGSIGEDNQAHIKVSKEILNETINRLRQAISFEARFSHLAGGFLIFLLFGMLIILSLFFSNEQQSQEAFLLQITSNTPEGKVSLITLMATLLYGIIGGFMSISVNIRKLKIVPELRPFQLGALRVLIAAISAVIVLLAIQSKWLFDLEISEENFSLVKLAAFAAGLSEDIAVNLAVQLLNQSERNVR